jgi:hypothetical protein
VSRCEHGGPANAVAWSYLALGIESQAAFIQGEKEDRVTNVEFQGTLASVSGQHARVNVDRLLTYDQRYGCRSWSG